MRRTFAAPIEKAFQAWVDPKKMAQWFARGPKMPPVKIIEADGKQGGRYRIECLDGDVAYRGWGTYKEFTPPEKLVFTWAWEHHDFGDSLITVEFRALGKSNFTEITLTHELLPEKDREAHRKGWEECFDMLDRSYQRLDAVLDEMKADNK
ncbi:MAG: SRPBCC domain-containing protein [Acidobacteria bacterium]|nr:SRPBCC domain-containing protein [Acidobacteriota bacterium]